MDGRFPRAGSSRDGERECGNSRKDVIEAAHYLHDTYNGGGILMDDSTTHLMTLARLPIHEYVAIFNGALWHAALMDPAPIARYIVVSENTQDGATDLLLNAVNQNPGYFADYTKVYTNGGVTIYERKAGDCGTGAVSGGTRYIGCHAYDESEAIL